MFYRRIPASLIERLTAEDVIRHALSSGWSRVQYDDGEIAILRRQDNEELLLPLTKDFHDYFDRLSDSIVFLADLEQKTPIQIIEDLLLPPCDELAFRVADQSTESGTLPFVDGLNLFNGAKKALAAAACTVVEPQGHYARLRRRESDAFLNACRMGQTAVGSFIAHILCPIAPLAFEENTPRDNLFGPVETFGRKTTKTLMNAIHTLAEAIEEKNEDALNNTLQRSGVSANLCDALLQMQPDSKNSLLSIQAQWDHVNPPSDVPNRTIFRKDDFKFIEQIGFAIKAEKPPERRTFIGTVDDLNGEPSPTGVEGEVMLTLFMPDESLKARVTLHRNDYIVACDAHRDSKLIIVDGELHRHSRIHEIKNHKYFNVIKDQINENTMMEKPWDD